MRLDDDELIAHGRECYEEFMSPILATTSDQTTDTAYTLWDAFSEDYQLSVAKALYQFRKAYKERNDATEHFDYAEKYRGAADDDGEGWRPPFEYYVQRRTEAVAAELNLADACRNLHDAWQGQEGAPYTQYYMGLYADAHEKMQNDLNEEVDGLREAAENKVKSLDREQEEKAEAQRKEEEEKKEAERKKEKKKKAAERKKKQKAKKKKKKKKGQDEDTEMVDADGEGGEEQVEGSTSKAGGGEGDGGDKAYYDDGEGEADPRKDDGDAGDGGDGGDGKVAAGVESGSEKSGECRDAGVRIVTDVGDSMAWPAKGRRRR